MRSRLAAIALALGLTTAAFAEFPVPELLPSPHTPPIANLPLPESAQLPPALPPELAPAPADGCLPGCDRVACLKQLLLVPHEQAICVPAWKLIDVEVGKMPTLELDFVEQKHVVKEMKLEEREVEQQVTCKESKPVEEIDPCTGKCCTKYVLCDVVKTVKVKVYEPVCVPTEVVVRVPVLKRGPDRTVKKVILDEATAPAIKRTYSVVESNNQLPYRVPAVEIPKCECPAGCCKKP